MNLAIISMAKESFDEAKNVLEYYFKNFADNVSLHRTLAGNYVYQGKLDLALSEVDMASMVKKFEELAYRIEEMEKKMQKMEVMPPVDEEVVEEVDMEEEELPKLDGAPVEPASKFSAEQPMKVGKKIKN